MQNLGDMQDDVNTASLVSKHPYLDDDDRTSESGEATLRILLAEHDHNLRRLIALVLRRDGHHVAEASDGAQLLDAVSMLIIDPGRRLYDLIISEQRLPGIQGLSVLSALRTAADTTPFVLMTEDRDAQAQAGRLDAVILDRPLNVETIRRAVRRAPLPRRAPK